MIGWLKQVIQNININCLKIHFLDFNELLINIEENTKNTDTITNDTPIP